MIKAVIFDMDGVIIDSEPVYYKRMIEYLEYKEHLFDDRDLLKVVGSSHKDTLRMICEIIGKELAQDEFTLDYNSYFKDKPVDYKEILYPEIKLLLRDLRAKGYKLALASSSSPENISHVLEECGITEYFPVILSGHDFENSKPHPEIYLTTAKCLGLKPEECMAVEDSSYGIESAKEAGMIVAAREDDRFGFDQERADYIFKDMRNIKLILREDRGDQEIPVKEIRVKSKEYVKSLFIRNNEHRNITGKSAFKISPEKEKDFIHLGYFNKEKLEAVLLYKIEKDKLIVEEFAISNISFGEGPLELLETIEERACEKGIKKIQVKAYGSEKKYLERYDYLLQEDQKKDYSVYEKTIN